jgi:hypothetical protein
MYKNKALSPDANPVDRKFLPVCAPLAKRQKGYGAKISATLWQKCISFVYVWLRFCGKVCV